MLFDLFSPGFSPIFFVFSMSYFALDADFT